MVRTDGAGDDWYVPLILKRITRIRPENSKRIYVYSELLIPDSDLVPEDLVGAKTRIGLNSTTEEAEARPHRRRTRYLRAWAEDSGETARDLHGLRQDSESGISDYKRSTPLDRARSTSAGRLQLDLLAHVHNNNTAAIIAHHHRAGAGITEWFGQFKPLEPYDLVRNLDPNELARSIDPKGRKSPLDLHRLIRDLDPEQLKFGKQKPKAA